MATYSEVKAGLDEIAGAVREARNVMARAKSSAALASSHLGELATTYADVVATVQAYGAGNAAEAAAKAELNKLIVEYQALKTVADQVAAANLG